MASRVEILGLGTLPEFRTGDDLPALVADAVAAGAGGLQAGDVVVVTQKAVSKAEGRVVDLRTVTPSALAVEFAGQTGKDPALVEVVLRETRRVVRMDRGVLIVETKQGFVCANAGVDRSNVPDDNIVTLLPVDADASAARVLATLAARWPAVPCGVLITDSFGRPWRHGITEVAIGVAGFSALESLKGRSDPYGYTLTSTEVAVADYLATAAGLVMGKFDRVPAAVVRGASITLGEGSVNQLLRPAEFDLFR